MISLTRRILCLSVVLFTFANLANALVSIPNDQTPEGGSVQLNDTDARFQYTGTWLTSQQAEDRVNGDQHYSNITNDYVLFSFTGKEVEIWSPLGPDLGYVELSVDGVTKGRVDAYAPTRILSKIIYRVANLPDTSHTIKLRVTGLKNAASTGTYIIVDGINVFAPTACVSADCHINAMPLYNQINAAFPNNGRLYCAPTTTAMMIQSQLDKPGVTVAVGSWTYNNFVPLYTTQVLAEAVEMRTGAYSGTSGFNIWRGFNYPLQDVTNSDGTPSVYEEDSHYPTQRTWDNYKAKLSEGYTLGFLIDHLREKRVYDGFPSCNLNHYEYSKNGGHFVAIRGYDENTLFVNNPLGPHQEKKAFGVMPHTKNGVPVQIYLESHWLVPDTMNVNYIGAPTNSNLPTTCQPNDANCQCDAALGIRQAPTYSSTPMDILYLAH